MAASTMKVRGLRSRRDRGGDEAEGSRYGYVGGDSRGPGLAKIRWMIQGPASEPLLPPLCSLPEAHPKRLSSTGRAPHTPPGQASFLSFPQPGQKSRAVRFHVLLRASDRPWQLSSFSTDAVGSDTTPPSPAGGSTFLPLGGHLLFQNKETFPL